MPLSIDDGYTITGKTAGKDKQDNVVPVVIFKYRPALPPALYKVRQEQDRAVNGEAEFAAVARFLVAHLTEWDVMIRDKVAPITIESLAHCPEWLINELSSAVTAWKPVNWEEAAKNSPAV